MPLRHGLRRSATLLAAVACLAATTTAGAEPTSAEGAVLAEGLFQEAKSLMQGARYADACPKLAESHRLDPQAGTLLYLAACYELDGRLASAWVTYGEAQTLAERLGRADHGKTARERREALWPRVPRVVLSLEAGDDAELELDGRRLGQAARGVPLPVDPGPHRVTAARQNAAPQSMTFVAVSGAEPLKVTVPKGSALPTTPTTHEPPASSAPAPTRTDATRPWIAGSLFGLGAIGLGIGTVFGVQTLGKKSEVDDYCGPNTCRDPRGIEAYDAAQRSATISTVAVVVGVAAAAAGAIVLLTQPSKTSSVAKR